MLPAFARVYLVQEVVSCSFFKRDDGCLMAQLTTDTVFAVRNWALYGDERVHYYGVTDEGTVGGYLGASSYNYSAAARPWFQQAVAQGPGYTPSFKFLGVPALHGSLFVTPTYAANGTGTGVPSLVGVAWAVQDSATCSSGCRMNTFAQRAALDTGAAVHTNVTLYSKAATVADLDTAVQPLVRVLQRDDTGGSPWVFVGLPNENNLGVVNCRYNPAYPGCTLSRSAMHFVAVVRNDHMWPSLGGRRVFYAVDADGSLGRRLGEQPNEYVTTSRPWYTDLGWTDTVSFTTGTLTASYSTPLFSPAGDLVAVTTAATVGPQRCLALQLARSFAVRGTTTLVTAVQRNLTTYTNATTVGQVQWIAAAMLLEYQAATGGGDPGLTVGAAASGDVYAVVSCAWGHSSAACQAAPGAAFVFGVANAAACVGVVRVPVLMCGSPNVGLQCAVCVA